MEEQQTTEQPKETQLISPPKDEDRITIQFIDQTGVSVFFKLKNSTPFEKVFNAYYSRTSRPAGSLRFFFDGVRVNPEDTPNKLQLENDDVIDVFLQQTGGSLLNK